MRFVIDEMFAPDAATRLAALGHDSVHVQDLGLADAQDTEVLERAVADDRALVTENATDLVPLLEARTASGLALTPVVLVLKQTLPAGSGAMNHALAERLASWADQHPEPYRHVHWLSR